MLRQQQTMASGRFVPFAEARLVPRCPTCHASNRQDLDQCTNCGTALPRCEPVLVPAIMADPGFYLGDLLMRVGNWLRGIGEKMQ